MAFWNQSVTENGVEVRYSDNCEVYRLTNTKTGEYDKKLDVYPDHVEEYSSKNSYWDKHDHKHIGKDGKEVECHGMEARAWKDKCRS